MTIYTEKTIKRVPSLGISKLSELAIDIDKDWLSYKIKNLGAPVDARDAVRKTDLDSHRTASPIDHPDASITTSKIAASAVTPSRVGVSLGEGINAVNWFIATGLDIFHHENPYGADITVTLLNKTLSDYSIICISRDEMRMHHRNQYPTWGFGYTHEMRRLNITSDHQFIRWSAGIGTRIAYEAVDLPDNHYLYGLNASGSSFKCYRAWVIAKTISSATPRFTATDTAYASGYIGIGFVTGTSPVDYAVPTWFPAFSRGIEALAVIEMDIEGSGKHEDPYRPSFSNQLVDIPSLQGLPDFLYREAKKYGILKTKGFTEDEMVLVFGHVPQHQVDLDSVTWGAFELSEKSPTNIIMVYGDNPYKTGAVQRQIDYAKSKNLRVFAPPKDFGEAVALYNKLKGDFKHWLAGKDNFAYMVLGLEELDLFQNVDFYYGELIEHKTHYQQLKNVPDFEIRNRLNELIDKLSKVTVLAEERDKHINKVKEILRKGW